jgi:hypothetical protein
VVIARTLKPVNAGPQEEFWSTPEDEASAYVTNLSGEPLMPKVLWSEAKLFVVDQPTVRLYRELKEELGRPFGDSSVMEAVAHCIDRDPDFVREYLEANFELDAQAELPPQPEKVAVEGVGEEGAAGAAEFEGAGQDGEVKLDEATSTGRRRGRSPSGTGIPPRCTCGAGKRKSRRGTTSIGAGDG